MVSDEAQSLASSQKPPASTKETSVAKPKPQDQLQKKHRFKFKGIWRETQLAKPKWSQEKYVSTYAGPLRMVQKSIVVDPEVLMRSNQLCYSQLRTLRENKKDFATVLGYKKLKNLSKQEDKTLNSIYFFYQRNYTMRQMKFLKACRRKSLMAKGSAKTIKETEEQKTNRMLQLATPKKPFKAKAPDRGHWKPLEQMSRYMDLAEPQKRVEVAPKNVYQVSEAAKNYVATDQIMKLAQQPRRYEEIEPPLEANRPVPRSALTYKITPKIEKLYVVKLRKEGTTTSPEDELWKISPAALKYKATPRILQLSKPIERK